MRKIVNRNINKRNKNNKELYDKNVYGQDLVVGDRVLMKNVSEMGGTGKLRNFGDNKIYKAISVCKDLPIYEIQPEKMLVKLKLYITIYCFCVTNYLRKCLPGKTFFIRDHNHQQYLLMTVN